MTEAEGCAVLRNISTDVIPFKCEASDYADEGVTISIALSADLCVPIDSEKKAIGMSLLLRHAEGLWIAEAEIGWTGVNIGWDAFESREFREESLDVARPQIKGIVVWAGETFRQEVAKISA